MSQRFFTQDLKSADPEIAGILQKELKRQQSSIELIASENIVSKAVLEAQSSVLTNKYAEGYPGRRYYNGCEFVDQAEALAIERAKKLFGCRFVNVQPHSGSQANAAVFLALLQPGDTISGLSLSAGGHLTHGSAPSVSGKWFKAVSYGVRPDNFLIDYEQLEQIAEEHKPKLIITGGSAYPRVIDLARIRRIADRIGAFVMFDMAHVAGLIAAGLYPDPLPFAHVVTTTTHKTLRGPRGGMILTDDPEIAKKINSAIFPGIQGGPLMHIIAAKAVAFGEALQPDFKLYQQHVLENSKILAETLLKHGLNIITGGTDTHLSLVDLRAQQITGKALSEALDRVGITVNKNALPFDPAPPTVTSGIRVGSPAATARGFDAEAFKKTGELIAQTAKMLIDNNGEEDPALTAHIAGEVQALCQKFPIYPDLSYC